MGLLYVVFFFWDIRKCLYILGLQELPWCLPQYNRVEHVEYNTTAIHRLHMLPKK